MQPIQLFNIRSNEHQKPRPITWELAGECWICTSHRPTGLPAPGYPKMVFNGIHTPIGRLVWSYLKNQDWPAGRIMLHSCDNTLCINPDHIHPGTWKQNMTDAFTRGRNPRQKLSPEQLDAIRNTEGIPHRVLAERYGVNQSTITRIRNRQPIE